MSETFEGGRGAYEAGESTHQIRSGERTLLRSTWLLCIYFSELYSLLTAGCRLQQRIECLGNKYKPISYTMPGCLRVNALATAHPFTYENELTNTRRSSRKREREDTKKVQHTQQATAALLPKTNNFATGVCVTKPRSNSVWCCRCGSYYREEYSVVSVSSKSSN